MVSVGNRDDFPKRTIVELGYRVGTLCSNPECCVLTFGPQMIPDKSTNIGVVAHIEGAAPGSARYNPSQSPEERSSISNGIWLCQNCAKMIDDDEQRFTVDLLRSWKKSAEDRARRALGNKRILADDLAVPTSIVLVVRQEATSWPRPDHVAGGKLGAKLSLVPLRAPHDLKDPWVPLSFAREPIAKGCALYSVTYQNQDEIIDQKIRVKIDFGRSAIREVLPELSPRVQVIEGGAKGSSYVTFYIPEALPKERQLMRVVAARGIVPKVEFWTKAAGASDEAFVFDLRYAT